MRRLRTSFSRQGAGDVGVSNLEKVASLPVQAGEQGEGSGAESAAKEMAAAATAADMPHELRRQMYHEANAFRHSPLFTQKVRMENKLDEHELLRVQLEALDYQEKHGVLLTEGDFYYRYPQSFDPSARPKPDAEDGQPQWAPFRDPGGAGPSLPTGQGSGGQGGGPIYGAQEGGETQSQWQSWLQRQRRRGWYSSTTLVYSTLFGAVVGASNFTTYWQQLQIWRSSMFFLPYLLFLFTVGLPTLQLELVLGNLLRGAAIKQNTQLSRWLVGLGILQVLTSISFVIITAVLSGQLLIYFVSSFSRPQPWQVTVSDMELCNGFHGNRDECNAAGHGVLCSYVPDTNICIASPTGKATLHYLEELQPSTLDSSLDPDALRPKALSTLAFVWLYILAYMWRGLFKAGFPSAILMIIAMVLCATLAVVSFFVGTDGSVHVASAVSATFDWRPLIHGFFDAAYSASLVRYICQDLCLGCCILGTVSSYTKIGFNTYPSGVFTCIVEFVMALAVTDIPLPEIIRKTGTAPAYFVVFPAAFEKVSSPYLFGLFFYGGVFLINTQVAAIGIHSVFNAVLAYDVLTPLHRRLKRIVVNLPSAACILFGGLCFIVGACYLIAVFCCQDSIFLPIWVMIFINALIAVGVAAFIKDPEAQAKTFKERFLALYLGGVRDLCNEVSRVTLFFPQPNMAGTSVIGLFPTLFCGCLTRPFFMFRPSTYWCVCIKHLVPFVMLVTISDACHRFDMNWDSMKRSPNMRNLGAALLGMAAVFLVLTPLIPKLRDWVRPVAEDYMSTLAFPSHPFVPWRRMSLLSLMPKLFREHLASSKEPSPIVKSLMLEYKKQRLPFMTSFPGEGAPGLSEVELAQQPRFRERSLDLQPRQQQTQQLSFGSKTSDDMPPLTGASSACRVPELSVFQYFRHQQASVDEVRCGVLHISGSTPNFSGWSPSTTVNLSRIP
ncbi:transporter, putative [Eimeria maxima]|uniref:Transporter, putative n=1 Tax=Eimeria maxima TaxID=5804 RepID=U6MC28_EIMMA|nr:transporter, putative [Eimeria maxima]CDJ59225.1 transporter, putative [Eimeria maxima]